jgi:hypothetical protein
MAIAALGGEGGQHLDLPLAERVDLDPPDQHHADQFAVELHGYAEDGP